MRRSWRKPTRSATCTKSSPKKYSRRWLLASERSLRREAPKLIRNIAAKFNPPKGGFSFAWLLGYRSRRCRITYWSGFSVFSSSLSISPSIRMLRRGRDCHEGNSSHGVHCPLHQAIAVLLRSRLQRSRGTRFGVHDSDVRYPLDGDGLNWSWWLQKSALDNNSQLKGRLTV